jgi:biotin carboxyl carrier protein
MKNLRITLEGKTYDVAVEILGDTASAPAPAPVMAAPAAAAPAPVAAAPAAPAPAAPAPAGGSTIASPMAAMVMKVKVAVGQAVADKQEIMVLEAMKMETPIYAASAGTVQAVLVKDGDSVSEGQGLVVIG